MRCCSTWLLIATLFAGGAGVPASARAAPDVHYPAELLRPYVPMVSMETDRRIPPEEWARRNNIDKSGLGARFGASGLIRCGGAVGTAQLTLRSNIITT